MPGAPAFYLHTLFAKQTGPHKITDFKGSSQAFKTYCAPIVENFNKGVMNARNKTTTENQIRNAIKTSDELKRKASAAAARPKTTASMEAKKQMRTIVAPMKKAVKPS